MNDKPPIDCRKIGGDRPIIISQETARWAYERIMKNPPDTSRMYADDASFVWAHMAELKAGAEAPAFWEPDTTEKQP